MQHARYGAGALGPLGVREFLEPVVRQIVASQLQVPSGWLTPGVSFAQDLATTVADLTQLVVSIERELHLHLDEWAIDSVCTYGDLVEVVTVAWVATTASPQSVLLRAVLVSGRRDRHGVVVRAMRSSPYELELLVDDARRAGPGSHLDLTMAADVPADALALVERRLARLSSRDIVVRIAHDQSNRRAVA